MIELRESRLGNTYRAVYAVRFADAVYVLHAFQKKSKSGARTAPADIALVERRMKALQADRDH